jgi:hypothetical protein
MGAVRDGYQWGRPAFQLASGLELPLTRISAVFTEYKFTWTHQRDNIAGGTATVSLQSHHFVGGVRWLF